MRMLRYALLALVLVAASTDTGGAATPTGRGCCCPRSTCKCSPRAEGSCCRARPTAPLTERRAEDPNEHSKSPHLSESLPIAADPAADVRLEVGLAGETFLFPAGDDAIYLTIRHLII